MEWNFLSKSSNLNIPQIYSQTISLTYPIVDTGQKKFYDNTIEIFLDYKPLKKKIMSIVTDSTPLEDPKDPDQSVIIDLYKLVAESHEVERLREQFLAGGYGYGHAKKELFELIMDEFGSERDAFSNYMKDIEDMVRQYPDQWLWLHRRWMRRN